jgi:hypothetical protein
VEFVRFDAADFEAAEPSSEAAAELFEKYKDFFAGAVSDENPYGFGYRLPPMVELEYLGIRLDDVSSTIERPAAEQAEQYYQRHRAQFTEQVRSDPNDPNSPPVSRQRSYAEVANNISQMLFNQRLNSRASGILREAADMADSDASLEFRAIAGRLGEKHNIRVYAGRTGRLGAKDIRSAPYLGRLYTGDSIYDSVELAREVFPNSEVQGGDAAPKTIGPARDVSGRIMAVFRVAERWPAREPEDLNETFSTAGPVFEPDGQGGSVYSAAEKVTEDLKTISAMEQARKTAGEFVEQAASQGWDEAIERFNEIHAAAPPASPDGPAPAKPFRLETRTGLRRTSPDELEALAAHVAGYPGGGGIIAARKVQARFVRMLYELARPETGLQADLPAVVEFKPHAACYAIKGISSKALTRQDYDKAKSILAVRTDMADMQTQAVVHLNPGNILKRADFRSAAEDAGGSGEPEANKGSS